MLISETYQNKFAKMSSHQTTDFVSRLFLLRYVIPAFGELKKIERTVVQPMFKKSRKKTCFHQNSTE